MKFSEMPYSRPDADGIKNQIAAFTERLKAAKTFEEAKAVFLENEELGNHVNTLAQLVSIRHSIDTRDKFYDDEQKWWNALGPELQEYNQAWTAAMLASPFRK
ncbi:MAG: M3 family oligoendopeptidase, partial [Firmicutes bacterium]|nr:M3 family oligoendopeptidase [Bacillota bacterium]